MHDWQNLPHVRWDCKSGFQTPRGMSQSLPIAERARNSRISRRNRRRQTSVPSKACGGSHARCPNQGAIAPS